MPKMMNQAVFVRWRSLHWVVLGIFLLVGGYLRGAGWVYNPIEGDQSILISIAMRFVNKGWEAFPLAANKSSAGIMNPPLIEYLYLLPLLVQPSIKVLHWFQAGLSLASVVVLYLYAAPLFGRFTALLAALLMTASPWAIYYGRFIWNPNPIPLFSTISLLALLATLAHGRSPAHFVLALLALAAVTQLHLSGLVLIPVFVLALCLFWPHWLRPSARQGWAWLGIGLGLAFLLYLPFLFFQIGVGFQDVQAVWEALQGGTENGRVVQINAASFLLNWDLASGHGFVEAVGLGGQIDSWARPLTAVMRFLTAFAWVWVIARPLQTMWQHRHWPHALPSRQRSYLILALWMTIPILLYIRHTVYLQNYYFLYIYPAPFLALALMLHEGWEWLQTHQPRLTMAATLLVVALPIGQIALSQQRLALLNSGQGHPVRTAAQMSDIISAAQFANQQHPTCHFIIVAQGGAIESSTLGLLEDFLYPTPVRFIDAGRGYIDPAQCTLYFNDAEDRMVAEWLSQKGTLVPYLPTHLPFYHVVEQVSPTAEPALAQWQNGLALMRWQVQGEFIPYGFLSVRYEWHVNAPPELIRYHFFNHLLNQQGELVAQEDAAAIQALYWQVGDTLVTQFQIPLPAELPAEEYRLLVGMYVWPDLVRVPLADGEDAYEVSVWSGR